MIENNLAEWLGGSAIATLFAKSGYDFWKRSQPANAQASANTALYEMLQDQMMSLHKELQLFKRQVVILEQLALKHGIDVEAAYRAAGIYDDSTSS